ncbi:MAG: redoxin domain-containing protein [Candidatus Marinimicrobia bacterium]|nr:redoxin domain-containing protein [Candidatus Neomarinimicrobiota bacterium]
MKTLNMLSAAIVFLILSAFPLTAQQNSSEKENVHNFMVQDIDGQDVSLEQYEGKVLLIVNTASKCGFTPQYEGLQALYEEYKDDGLVVLGFPANNFGGQEPGTDEQIQQFCTTNFGVTFPMFSKISVKGSDQHPLYQYLTSKETNPEYGGAITWNFNKFLVNEDGKVINRFASKDAPQSDKVVTAVKSALSS